MLETQAGKRFFVMFALPGFAKGREMSLCSWWVQGVQGVVEPEGLIPMELDGPVFEPEGRPGLVPWPKLKGKYGGLEPFLAFPVRAREAFLVVSMNAGILWIVPEDTHSPGRVVKLMGLTDEELAGTRKHPPVILDLQPMRDGRVLVALRTEKAIHEPNPRPDPGIVWKVVDPVPGRVEEPDPGLLEGAPDELDPQRPFSFTFDMDGRLKVTGGGRSGSTP
ncbi:hypothetical protein [Mesoterricola silvestris]|nr:hypothetical protein [Mesoterricola silvestris]